MQADERKTMTSRIPLNILCILLVLTVASCTLPAVTPAVEVTQEPTSSFSTTTDAPQPSAVTPQNAAVITDGNLGSLDVTARVAVVSPQLLEWSTDSQTLSVVNQTTDAGGNQLFGVTTLLSPSLTPKYVYSVQGSRISDVAADGRTVAVITQDMMSYALVDLGANNTTILSNTPGFLVGKVTFSPDLRYVAVTQAELWEVVLYNLVNGAEVRRLSGFETAAPVFDAGYSASPQWILWHARAKAQLQEVETGKLSPEFNHEDFLSAYTTSPDGTLLATAAGKTVNGAFSPTVTLWDVVEGVEMHTLILSESANALSFSPDGKLLAVAAGKDLQLWRVSDGSLIGTFSEHLDFISLVKFSPDGKAIATAGFDNQLYLWQVLQ
jgi:WD40 repeat protein